MEEAKNIEEKLKRRYLENCAQIGEVICILTKWFFQNSEKTIAVTHKVMQTNPGVILTWKQENGNIAKWMSVKGFLYQVCFKNSPSQLFLSLLLRIKFPYLEFFWFVFSRIGTEYRDLQCKISNTDTLYAVFIRGIFKTLPNIYHGSFCETI